MGKIDWSSLPPSPWTDEERSQAVRAAAARAHAKRGYDLSDEERRRVLRGWLDEARAKRGYDLTPEENERIRYEAVLEGRTKETARRALAAVQPTVHYHYGPPSGPLVVREKPPGETQLDRIERRLGDVERGILAMRVHLEALESKVDSFADHIFVVERKLDDLTVRVQALEEKVERVDLRVLRLESALGFGVDH